MVRGSPEQPEPEPEPEESPLSLQGVPAHLRGAEVFPSCSGHASPPYCGSGAHAELALRCEAFARGEWLTRLHADARTSREAPHLAAARSAAHDVETRAQRAAAL